MKTRNVLSILVIALFLGGVYWYFLNKPVSTPIKNYPVGLSTTTGALSAPTSIPYVNGPKVPPITTQPTKSLASVGDIRGSVTIGPVCPVQRIPPDPNCTDKAYATTLVVNDVTGNSVKTITVGDDGKFEISLPAGTYRVGPATQAYLPRASFQEVIVRANKTTTITVQFDSGMR